MIIYSCLFLSALEIRRPDDNGGNASIKDVDALRMEFAVGTNPAFPLHPGDLKAAIVEEING